MMDMADNTRKHGAAWAAELASRSNFPPVDQRETDESLRQEVFDAVAASDPEGYALSCEMMVDESHKDPEYSQIACPTLIIAGKYDVIGPVQKSKEIVELIGAEKCRLEVLDCGHQPIIEHASKVEEAIDSLLQAL
jgi:3-oxoadipate enol-lactonase